MASSPNRVVVDLLSTLLVVYWMAAAQHQTHVALLKSWAFMGLASSMQYGIDDEPVAITALTTRIMELDGQPAFEIGTPNIGTDLRSVLENDIAIQRGAPAGLLAGGQGLRPLDDIEIVAAAFAPTA